MFKRPVWSCAWTHIPVGGQCPPSTEGERAWGFIQIHFNTFPSPTLFLRVSSRDKICSLQQVKSTGAPQWRTDHERTKNGTERSYPFFFTWSIALWNSLLAGSLNFIPLAGGSRRHATERKHPCVLCVIFPSVTRVFVIKPRFSKPPRRTYGMFGLTTNM